MTVPYSANPSEPTLRDALNITKKEVFLSMNCHHIGTIQSFNSDNQTASATVNYKKTYYQLNTESKQYVPVLKDYPQLIDCPVICLGGAGASLTFPIAAGDECLIIFNDRDLDSWFQGNPTGAVATSRLHSFSDGIIIVGIRSALKSLQGYDSDRAVLKNVNAKVAVGTDLIEISNNITTLNTLLQTLITTLQGLTTTNAVVGVPCAVSAVSIAALGVVASEIAGLLE